MVYVISKSMFDDIVSNGKREIVFWYGDASYNDLCKRCADNKSSADIELKLRCLETPYMLVAKSVEIKSYFSQSKITRVKKGKLIVKFTLLKICNDVKSEY